VKTGTLGDAVLVGKTIGVVGGGVTYVMLYVDLGVTLTDDGGGGGGLETGDFGG
jgi:hypothetical protein